jgi:hypothetical protein
LVVPITVTQTRLDFFYVGVIRRVFARTATDRSQVVVESSTPPAPRLEISESTVCAAVVQLDQVTPTHFVEGQDFDFSLSGVVDG